MVLAWQERFGDELKAASDYHQLGIVAEEEHKFDEAKRWYNKALEIHERLSYLGGKAADFGQLGRLAGSWVDWQRLKVSLVKQSNFT